MRATGETTRSGECAAAVDTGGIADFAEGKGGTCGLVAPVKLPANTEVRLGCVLKWKSFDGGLGAAATGEVGAEMLSGLAAVPPPWAALAAASMSASILSE